MSFTPVKISGRVVVQCGECLKNCDASSPNGLSMILIDHHMCVCSACFGSDESKRRPEASKQPLAIVDKNYVRGVDEDSDEEGEDLGEEDSDRSEDTGDEEE